MLRGNNLQLQTYTILAQNAINSHFRRKTTLACNSSMQGRSSHHSSSRAETAWSQTDRPAGTTNNHQLCQTLTTFNLSRTCSLHSSICEIHVQLWASCSHTCASVHQAVKIGTGASWELNRHSTQHTSPVSMDYRFGWFLAEGYWNGDQLSPLPPYGPLWLGKDFSHF